MIDISTLYPGGTIHTAETLREMDGSSPGDTERTTYPKGTLVRCYLDDPERPGMADVQLPNGKLVRVMRDELDLPTDEDVRQATTGVLVYVNAYAVSREYGGPEEGGWWYDAGEPLASVPLEVFLPPMVWKVTRELVAEERERGEDTSGWDGGLHWNLQRAARASETVTEEIARLTDLLGFTTQHNRYSVLGGDDFEIMVQTRQAESFPRERPHYE